MKMKNIDIYNKLRELAPLTALPLPIKLTYAFFKNAKKMEKENEYCSDLAIGLLSKYDGDDKNAEYQKELNELLNIEVDIDFQMVSESVLDGDFEITLQQLSALDFMIE